MKTPSIHPFLSIDSRTAFNVFDPIKFAKRVQEKDRKGWWQKFLTGVELKRMELLKDLDSYGQTGR